MKRWLAAGLLGLVGCSAGDQAPDAGRDATVDAPWGPEAFPDAGCRRPEGCLGYVQVRLEPFAESVDDVVADLPTFDAYLEAPCAADGCFPTTPPEAWRETAVCLSAVMASGGRFSLCLEGGKVTTIAYAGGAWVPCSPELDAVEFAIEYGLLTLELHDLHAGTCEGPAAGGVRGTVSVRFDSSECGSWAYFGCGP